MSNYTEKLEFFKYDTKNDGANFFNIEKALNENWDKIDMNAKAVNQTIGDLAENGTGAETILKPKQNNYKTATDLPNAYDIGITEFYTEEASWKTSTGLNANMVIKTDCRSINYVLQVAFSQNRPVKFRVCKSADVWADWEEFSTTSQLNALTEEGIWTPKIIGATTAGILAIKGKQIGVYTKIKRKIFCNFYITGTLTGAQGTLRLSGLPYPPKDACYSGYLGACIGIQATVLANSGVSNFFNFFNLDTALLAENNLNKEITVSGTVIYDID